MNTLEIFTEEMLEKTGIPAAICIFAYFFFSSVNKSIFIILSTRASFYIDLFVVVVAIETGNITISCFERNYFLETEKVRNLIFDPARYFTIYNHLLNICFQVGLVTVKLPSQCKTEKAQWIKRFRNDCKLGKFLLQI